MTASREILARFRSSTPPWSAARTGGPGRRACPPGSAAMQRTPSGSTGSARDQGWPGQPHHLGLEHRARRGERARGGRRPAAGRADLPS